MNRSRAIKLLAYLFIPVIFSVIGYLIIYIGIKPYWEMTVAAASLLGVGEETGVSEQIASIYDPNAKTEHPVELRDGQYIHINDVRFPVSGAQYGYLSCDRIDLESPVYWGDTNDILRVGAGQYLASYLPGFGRLIVLSGHNNTYFRPLKDIEKGDIVTFDTNYCKYEYEITKVEVMNENELKNWLLDHVLEDEEVLVMYTCYPFSVTAGRKTDRLTVFGKRITGYDVKWRDFDEE